MTTEQLEKKIKELSRRVCCLNSASSRFGVAGEDNTATQNRAFTLGNFEFSLLDNNGNTNLLLDPANDINFFGFDTAGDKQLVTGWSFDEANIIEGRAAGKVGLRIVETINGFEAYLGDVDNTANGNKITINDNDNETQIISNGVTVGYFANDGDIQAAIGDPNNAGNGTTVRVVDNQQKVEITNVPAGAITNDFATFDGDQIKKIPAPVESGTYTPTISNAINVATSSPSEFQYMRVANVVTVSGQVTIETTAAANTLTSFELSIPIASSFPNGNEIGGTLWGLEGAKNGGGISCTGANAQAVYYSASIVSDQIFIHFTYLIVAAP